jgi:membrane protein
VKVPVLGDALRLFSDKGARFLAAAVAFYALLSAAPLFIVILSVVGWVFGRPSAESALWDGLAPWVAPEGLAAIRGMTERLESMQRSSGVVGVVLVIYGSTRLFRALRRSLNQLWGIDLESIERARPSVHRYGVKYGGALLLTFFSALLVALLILVKAGFAMMATLTTEPPSWVLWGLDAVVSVALAFALFWALFRFLPETRVTFREATTSAVVSTLLFAFGSAIVTLYVRQKRLGDIYQGASAVVLAVVWVYYSAQVFFFGACVGAAMRRGSERTDPSSQPAAGL